MLIRSSTLFSQCNALAAATKKVLKKLYASSSTMSPPSQSVRSVPSVPTVRRANRLTRGLRSSDIGGVQCVPLICGASMLRCTVRCSVHPAALQLHSTVCTPRTDSGTVGQWDRRTDGRHSGTCSRRCDRCWVEVVLLLWRSSSYCALLNDLLPDHAATNKPNPKALANGHVFLRYPVIEGKNMMLSKVAKVQNDACTSSSLVTDLKYSTFC